MITNNLQIHVNLGNKFNKLFFSTYMSISPNNLALNLFEDGFNHIQNYILGKTQLHLSISKENDAGLHASSQTKSSVDISGM